jgi:hypothetical protein
MWYVTTHRTLFNMGAKTNAYKIVIRQPEGKRLLRRHGCRREDNNKMDPKEI